MKVLYRIIAFFLLLILGTILGQFVFRYLYYFMPAGNGPILLGTDQSWSFIFGEIASFYFFLSLLVVALFNKQKYYIWIAILILLLPVLVLFHSDLFFDGMLLTVTVIGWLIGEGINFLITKNSQRFK